MGLVWVAASVAILKRLIVVPFSPTLCTVFIKNTGDTLSITLAASPIVTSHGVLKRCFFLLLGSLQILRSDCHLADEKLVFSQDQIFVMTARLWFWERIDCSPQVDSSFWIVEVGKLAIIIDEDRNFAEHVSTAKFAIFSLNLHVKLHTGSTE